MKKLLITVLMLAFGLTYATAQRKSNQVDKTKMTQEQRMVQSNSKKKKGGSSADVSRKVKNAKKADRKARKMKAPNNRRSPKRK